MEDDYYPDYATERDYCKHGTYVGNWAGPDYMCGYCEDGISDSEYAAMTKRYSERQRRKRALTARLDALILDVIRSGEKVTEDDPRFKRVFRMVGWGVQPTPGLTRAR